MNKLVVIFGLPGSGKSTLGKILSEKIGYAFYDMDDTLPSSMKEKLKKNILITEQEIEGYVKEIVLHLERLLTQKSVVASLSLFLDKHKLLIKNNFPEASVFNFEASPESLKRRLINRKGHFFNEKLLGESLVFNEPISFDYYPIDVDRDIDSIVVDILSHIK